MLRSTLVMDPMAPGDYAYVTVACDLPYCRRQDALRLPEILSVETRDPYLNLAAAVDAFRRAGWRDVYRSGTYDLRIYLACPDHTGREGWERVQYEILTRAKQQETNPYTRTEVDIRLRQLGHVMRATAYFQANGCQDLRAPSSFDPYNEAYRRTPIRQPDPRLANPVGGNAPTPKPATNPTATPGQGFVRGHDWSRPLGACPFFWRWRHVLSDIGEETTEIAKPLEAFPRQDPVHVGR